MVAELRDVVIVGTSAAGVSAARTLRRSGFGGAITMIGSEPDAPYQKPPLSKSLLDGDPNGGVSAIGFGVNTDLGVSMRLGYPATAVDLSDRVVHTAVADYPFGGLVIAAGAAPVNPWTANGLEGLHVLRTLADAIALRQHLARASRVAVIGAGFIGAEVTAAARKRGLPVTLIDALPTPHATTLGELVGSTCVALHREHGTRLRLGSTVVAIEGDDVVRGVRLDGDEFIDADLVVVGVGVRPVTGWLADSGLRLNDGVECDEYCRVLAERGNATDGVVAAGDIARWHNAVFGESARLEHWDNAVAQGKAAALTLLGGASPYAPVPYFWSDQYDTKIQFVGSARYDDDVVILEGDVVGRSFIAGYVRRGRIVGAAAIDRPRRLGLYRKLIWPPTSFRTVVRQASISPAPA